MAMRAHAAPGGVEAGDVVNVINAHAAGDVVLVCEHASNFIPPQFRDLGLNAEERTSHIAWDPGALAVARVMSQRLDAPLVAQCVSRLVYDCNRPPDAAAAVPEMSEVYTVPGNQALSPAARQTRIESYYLPFRDTLAGLLEQRAKRAGPPVVITIHTFTPIFHGVARDVEIGLLYDSDSRLADAMVAQRAHHAGHVVRRNEPYGPADGVTHTLREHALPQRYLNVMIEVRNDLVATAGSQERMGELLSGWVADALAALDAGGNGLAGARAGEVGHA